LLAAADVVSVDHALVVHVVGVAVPVVVLRFPTVLVAVTVAALLFVVGVGVGVVAVFAFVATSVVVHVDLAVDRTEESLPDLLFAVGG
jgi:hypothetical protein